MNDLESTKQLVGEAVASHVKDGMRVGLGSGSTMFYMIRKLGQRVREEGLNIEGIPTSERTAAWAKEFGIPLTDFSHVQELDIAIDGADEVDPDFQLIKGGGGALLREKIVAAAAKTFYVIIDDSKLVKNLGTFPLPVEIIPFGWEVTKNRVALLGGHPELRKEDDEVFLTDNGNYILDCHFDKIAEPEPLHHKLKSLPGVIETGLFINMTTKVFVGRDGEVKMMKQQT